MSNFDESSETENQRVILYPPGGNYNQLRNQQTFLNELLEEHKDLPETCDRLGRNRREYIRENVMPRIPGGVWVYDRSTKNIRRLDKDQAEIKILQKLRDKIKYSKQRSLDLLAGFPFNDNESNIIREVRTDVKSELKKRVVSATKSAKKSPRNTVSPSSIGKPKVKSGIHSADQKLQDELQFLYVLCSDQKRHIEFLKERVGKLESSLGESNLEASVGQKQEV